MSEVSTKYITVFIPTSYSHVYLDEVLAAVEKQELPPGYKLEILIIDSAGSPPVLEIIKKHKQVKLLQIPNSEFSHGGTRQKAVEMARGEFMLLITDDATPASNRWLINMIEPFFVSTRVGVVLGRQIPRPGEVPTIKREVAQHFANFGPDNMIAIHRPKSLVDGKPVLGNAFLSDCNSAVRLKLLKGEVPFRNIPYAEDQALAADMFKHGYLKAYAPEGSVWHSNTYSIRDFFHRKYGEYIGLKDTVGYELRPSPKNLLLGWIKPTLRDYKFLRYDKSYPLKTKLKWLVLAPGYNIANAAGHYLAAKHQHDRQKTDNFSWEQRRRHKENEKLKNQRPTS